MFIIMSFLGPDLSKLRNEQLDRKFTPATALRVGMQTLTAIQELHAVGFLSVSCVLRYYCKVLICVKTVILA